MTGIRESDLPGIGRKFQVDTRSGDKLVVVIHEDGKRELFHFEEGNPDEWISVVTLDDPEARQLAGIIGGLSYQPRALESPEITLEDLVIDWLKIPPDSKAVGKTIGELDIRRETGAIIVAAVGRYGKKINPGPEYVLTSSTTLVIIGERDQLRSLKRLITDGP
ncbi:MAG: cation:proton antiporter regulatory subunit [Firmicutes bacterium]|nr:cation:proton antiporter regulatory subunit [Bacillota bacterium]